MVSRLGNTLVRKKVMAGRRWVLALALLLPVAARADAAAGLVEEAFGFLVLVPVVLGWIEAVALRLLFKVRRPDAFRNMLFANYVSTAAGMVMIELTPSPENHAVMLWVLAYVITLFAEAPYVAKLSDSKYWSKTTWIRTAVVNQFTYALLALLTLTGFADSDLFGLLLPLSVLVAALWLMALAESKVLRRMVKNDAPRRTALLCCANVCVAVAAVLVLWVLTFACPTDPPQTDLLHYASDMAANPILWVMLFGVALACKNAFVAALTKQRYCSPVTLGRTLALSLCGCAVLVVVGAVFLLSP